MKPGFIVLCHYILFEIIFEIRLYKDSEKGSFSSHKSLRIKVHIVN